MRKLLASDFDGTIYFKGQYKEEDLKAIAHFQAQGNLFGLCSGRPLRGLLPFIPPSLHLDFYICCSGACLYNGNGEVIERNLIPKKTLEKVLTLFKTQEIFVMGEKGLYTFRSKGTYEEALITHASTIEDLQDDVVLGISFDIEDEAKRHETMSVLKTLDTMDCFENVTAIDCVAKGCSKYTGLEAMSRYFHLEPSQIASIGDAANDIPMLRYAPSSFTFESSADEVKKNAKYVVAHTYEAIDYLLNENQ